MKQVILLKGLPAAGKTTWSLQQMEENPGCFKRVNKDELRSLLDGGRYSPTNEKMICDLQDYLILLALEQGKHVIVDNTHLNPYHEKHIRELIKGKASLQIKEFDTSVEECITRDKERINSVGEKVIRDMYERYSPAPVSNYIPNQENPTPPLTLETYKGTAPVIRMDLEAFAGHTIATRPSYNNDRNLPRCWIFDIDGTLALKGDRGYYDWKKVGIDIPNVPVISMIRLLHGQSLNVFIFSGRDECCRKETEAWLEQHHIFPDGLYMRPEKNNEKDYIIKERMLREHIEGKYYVEAIFDDRPQVIRLWKSLGLFVFNCGDGIEF